MPDLHFFLVHQFGYLRSFHICSWWLQRLLTPVIVVGDDRFFDGGVFELLRLAHFCKLYFFISRLPFFQWLYCSLSAKNFLFLNWVTLLFKFDFSTRICLLNSFVRLFFRVILHYELFLAWAFIFNFNLISILVDRVLLDYVDRFAVSLRLLLILNTDFLHRCWIAYCNWFIGDLFIWDGFWFNLLVWLLIKLIFDYRFDTVIMLCIVVIVFINYFFLVCNTRILSDASRIYCIVIKCDLLKGFLFRQYLLLLLFSLLTIILLLLALFSRFFNG